VSRAVELARTLWANEPVLVSSVPAILVTIGIISTTQASAAPAIIGSITAAATELAVAFGARSQVSPVRKPAPPAETPAP
jgi:hypothetical protein